MLLLKYHSEEDLYKINLKKVSSNVIHITGDFPIKTNGFEIYKDNLLLGNYTSYTSIYRIIENGVEFSNDGSIYIEPSPTPIAPPTPLSLEEVKATKKKEITSVCDQTIYSGINVTFSDNHTEHFSLTEKDQINLLATKDQLESGSTQLEYHQDGQLYRYYTPEEINKIIDEAFFHIGYHRAYCNGLNVWIASSSTVDDVQLISYGADIPEQYRSEVLNDYLEKIMTTAKA